MNHLRRITSMQEDFQALGIAKQDRRNGLPSERLNESTNELDRVDLDENDAIDLDLSEGEMLEAIDADLDDLLSEGDDCGDDDDDEDDDDDDEGDMDESLDSDFDLLNENADDISEALLRKRLTRQKASERAKARRQYKKKRSTILRKRKRRERKSKFKIRKKRIDALRGNKKAGHRRRFTLKQDMSDVYDQLNSLESIDLKGNVHVEMLEAFERVDEMATILSRKFAVCDEMLEQMELDEDSIPIEHPDSEYDYENPDDDYAIDGKKTGDATDSAKDAPKGNVGSKDDHPEPATPKGNVKFEACGKDHEEEDEDEDDDMEEAVDMPSEMVMLRLEAQDVMDKLTTHVISPAEAGAILKDMVGYLGGAMKAYMDLAKSISMYSYAGMDLPPEYDGGVTDNVDQTGHNYVGKDGLDSEAASPQEYKDRT